MTNAESVQTIETSHKVRTEQVDWPLDILHFRVIFPISHHFQSTTFHQLVLVSPREVRK